MKNKKMTRNSVSWSAFVSLLAAGGLQTGCQGEVIQYPTYAGTYGLVRVEYRGFGTDRGWTVEKKDFPFEVQAPETLELDQRGFRRTGGGNQITLALYSDAGLVWTNDSNAKMDPLLGYPTGWTDTSSPYLGIDVGYACRWQMHAALEFKISPEADVLNEIYPACQPAGELCLTPQKWTDLPVYREKALGLTPVIELEMKVGMGVNGTGYDAACGKPASESRVRLTYELIAPKDIGDPRVDDPVREERFSHRLNTAPQVSPQIFGLPEKGVDLLTVFPH